MGMYAEDVSRLYLSVGYFHSPSMTMRNHWMAGALLALSLGAQSAVAADISPDNAEDMRAANDEACRIAKSPRLYVGKTLRFRGQFLSDYRERSRLRPLGCDYGFPVDSLSEQAEAVITPRGFLMGRPWSERIVVTVEGHLARREANGLQFQHDDGVRLDVTKANDLQVFDIGYPKRFD